MFKYECLLEKTNQDFVNLSFSMQYVNILKTSSDDHCSEFGGEFFIHVYKQRW